MKKTEEDRVSNQNPVAAALDRKRRNKLYRDNFAPVDVFMAEAFAAEADRVYFRRNTYLNFNKSNITVKINKPLSIDTLEPGVRALDAGAISEGVEIKREKNGNLIYVLPFEPVTE